ncbi:hypothetical protein [Chryseobacterium aurantiacum]|uniref:hypothetical protein n=1 Tax=Chryseobacterium aurantiacum TaxID=2116499 RepID=UPI000D13ADC7|nr:hypothetical protein [Chryseobacterium aurantiacum]
MKKLSITLSLWVITLVILPIQISAQLIIGDQVGTAANKTSVLLEFANTNNKGIIVPYVRTLPSSPTPGTLLLDVSDPVQARFKVYNQNPISGTNGWFDLSGQNGSVTPSLAVQPVGIAETGAKTIIGDSSSSVEGVLVLESPNKAMVLPIVTDVSNILNPSPGMMVYVSVSPTSKRLAFFNGSKWSFWQAQ